MTTLRLHSLSSLLFTALGVTWGVGQRPPVAAEPQIGQHFPLHVERKLLGSKGFQRTPFWKEVVARGQHTSEHAEIDSWWDKHSCLPTRRRTDLPTGMSAATCGFLP